MLLRGVQRCCTLTQPLVQRQGTFLTTNFCRLCQPTRSHSQGSDDWQQGKDQLDGNNYRSSSSRNPQIPLSERPSKWSSPSVDVCSWYLEALNRLAEVGDSLSEDGGPVRNELEVELEWLMEDAVVGWKEMNESNSISSAGGTPGDVQLRMPLMEIRDLWERRIVDRMPLQYLTCSAFWRDMVLSVGPGVLIPRPETELMIDFVIEAAESNPSLAVGEWADLGTGSGALAVGVARALPHCQRVIAADIAPEPLKYVSFNAKRYDVGDRVKAIESNWLDGLRAEGITDLSGLVSNPPYIPAQDVQTLQAEVALHEPKLALDGGEALAIDSLMPICRGASEILRPGGFLALETGGGEQAQYVSDILEQLSTFVNVTIRPDLRGVRRFVTAFKKQ